MKLSDAQLELFGTDGLLLLPNLFSTEEVALMRERLAGIYAQDTPANIREKDSDEVRTAMGLHLRDEIYAKLVRHPRLVEPAMQILGEPLYIQQVKVNVKAAFCGEPWQWHYDF
ncbi:MAG TPA: phytanoyl-CoA dioxygenase family protein, partial [Gammaproteobacteria bacterium]